MRVNVALDHAVVARFSPDSLAFLVALANENRLRVYRISRPTADGAASAPPPITPAADMAKVSGFWFWSLSVALFFRSLSVCNRTQHSTCLC